MSGYVGSELALFFKSANLEDLFFSCSAPYV
jgi:hypothetical protein